MFVVGAKEAENQAVSYRDRTAGDLGAMPLADALARLRAECDSKQSRPADPPPAVETAEAGTEDHTY